jgi:hypothetical protein
MSHFELVANFREQHLLIEKKANAVYGPSQILGPVVIGKNVIL